MVVEGKEREEGVKEKLNVVIGEKKRTEQRGEGEGEGGDGKKGKIGCLEFIVIGKETKVDLGVGRTYRSGGKEGKGAHEGKGRGSD